MLWDFLSFLFVSSAHTKVGVRLLVASLELVALASLLGLFFHFFRIRSARFKAMLWIFVLIKPILTLAAGSPIVLARVEIDPLSTSQITELRRNSDALPVKPENFNDDLVVTNGVDTTDSPTLYGTTAFWSFPLTSRTLLTCLALAWIIGICVGGVHWAIAGRRLGKILHRGILPTERILNLYRELIEEKQIEKPPLLLLSAELESPVIFGAIKPIIMFPVWLADTDNETIRHLLAHELGHHQHRDPLALAFAKLSLVLFFFNPVAHWAFRQWMGCAEIACDRSVIDSREEAREYAGELLSVLEGMQSRQAALSGLYATRHQIGTRMDALLDDPMASQPELGRLGAV
ncbi:MAG: M56 family metallopeptidase, partial [Candidatus Omnitrophica bacterium]|nr:M56 family metallopeptidase [Candidatus Omnitrophota bacterium]